MGAKTWMLVYAEGSAAEILKAKPPLDRGRTVELAGKLFPGETLHPLEDGDLSYTCPPDDELHAGCFAGVTVVAAKEFAPEHPSTLSRDFIAAGLGNDVYLHAMHSVVDWFAYAHWHDGKLVRALSLSPDSGVLEDVGERKAFETPYWAGQHPAFEPEDADEEDEPYPFDFHPLELGEAALGALFGFQLEGPFDPTLLDPESIPLMRFKRSKARPRWRFW